METQYSRILIVDDSSSMHNDTRKILEMTMDETNDLNDLQSELFRDVEPVVGFKNPHFIIESAYNGETGLELLRKAKHEGKPFSVAIVDVRMPQGWDGIETMDRFWQEDPNIQIIICTAYSDYDWKSIIKRVPHPDQLLIIKKPFYVVELLQATYAMTAKWASQIAQRKRENKLSEDLKVTSQSLKMEQLEKSQLKTELSKAQQLESLVKLADDVVHELNNFLTVIHLSTESLLSELPSMHGQDNQEFIGKFGNILDSTNQAVSLIRRVLDFNSRASSLPKTKQFFSKTNKKPLNQIKNQTVLVVDDQQDICDALATYLTNSGLTVLKATHPEAALSMAKTEGQKIDLLITDVMMPGMSGVDLATKIREKTPDVRVIFMTGYAGKSIADYKSKEQSQWLLKPFSPRDLESRIQTALSKENTIN